MQFYSYNKIYSTISEKYEDNVKLIDKWYIFEKIHGANFSFHYFNETNEIKYSRRTGFIEPNEKFYSYELILQDVLPKINQIISMVKKSNPNSSTIIIYGELFGGYYPNIEKKCSPVQKGVCYSPDIHFCAFDIKIIENELEYYMDISESLEIFKNSNIFYSEPLLITDSYEVVSNYPIHFNSLVPKKFNLEELPINKAEGVVIKSSSFNNKRIVFKKKIPEFEETIRQCSKKSIDLDNKNDLLKQINSLEKINEALLMCTQNRLDNSSSKIGDFSENKWKIYKLMADDIIEELEITDKNEMSMYKKVIMNEIKNKFN